MRKPEIDKRLKDVYRTIGDRIVNLRGRMNQNELAEKAEVSRATISAIEQGKAISLKNLIKITTVLDIPLEAFFMISPPSFNIPIKISENNIEEARRLLSRLEYLLQIKKQE